MDKLLQTLLEISIYTRVFSSELIGTSEGGKKENTPDPTVPEVRTNQTMHGDPGRTFQLYKELVDKEGNVVEQAEFGRVTYQPATY